VDDILHSNRRDNLKSYILAIAMCTHEGSELGRNAQETSGQQQKLYVETVQQDAEM
jgi:hypothetical protein